MAGAGDLTVFLTEEVALTNGETVSLPDALPVGDSCWATESDDGGATRTAIDFDGATNAVEVTEEDLPIAISATNTFHVVSLRVDKPGQERRSPIRRRSST